ncbi:MAG: DUF4126 domain-containing protein [Verrucomicrobiae bacterium]|jgi:hypothetical protein|nr:DUF4126 domain-containing protein [Verrucomicrobiae bacterium]
MNEIYEVMLSLFVGVGLAAACGFRVFVPLLVTSLAVKTGHLGVIDSFAWLGSDAALATFAVATACELFAYYIPWLDNALDVIASPCAVVAGTVVMASFVPEMDPWLKWSLSAIAGGAAAGAVQSVTTVLRGASTAVTGGVANPLVSTGEALASTGLSATAVLLPGLATLGLLGLVGFVGWKVATRPVRRMGLAGGQAVGLLQGPIEA